MAKDSEKRSYSVNEMMEQLKKGEREKSRTEEAELVTRSDGSKVMRVRRRKRRSGQSSKGVHVRQRRYGLVGMLGLVSLLVVCGIAVVVVVARFNSRTFREKLEETLGESTGAKSKLSEFSVSPVKARAKSAQFTWSTGGLPRTLSLSGLEAPLKVTSFFNSRLQGAEVYAQSGMMTLAPPDGTITPLVRKGEQLLDYERYRCSQFDLSYGVDSEGTLLGVRGSELTARPHEEGEGFRFNLTGGFVNFGTWGELKIDHGLADWRNGTFNLISLFARSGDVGELVLKGVTPLTSSGSTVLDVKLEKFPLGDLLGVNSLGRLIQGQVDVPSGSLSFDPRMEDSARLKLPYTATDVSMQGFRFLSGLASILRKDHYAYPEGGTMSGTFNWDREQLSIEDFKFEMRFHLKLEGSLRVREDEFSGEIRVGVPEDLMMKSPTEPRYPSFSTPRLGYCWADVRLSGTLEQPNDDFFEKLQASPVKQKFPSGDE